MYIDRWYVGLFMLLKAKWVFLLYGSPCIQIMGGLINLHTKHPFMTKSEFAWAKAMHTCTGRHIKINQNMWSGESIRQFSLGTPACFSYFKTHTGFDVQVETDNVGKMMGIIVKQICEPAHHETTIEGVRLTNSSRPVWTDFPGENSNLEGESFLNWMSGGVVGWDRLKSCLHHFLSYSDA